MSPRRTLGWRRTTAQFSRRPSARPHDSDCADSRPNQEESCEGVKRQENPSDTYPRVLRSSNAKIRTSHAKTTSAEKYAAARTTAQSLSGTDSIHQRDGGKSDSPGRVFAYAPERE
jgi:hypothetical protein